MALASLTLYTILSELLGSIHTYECWNHIRIDSTTAKIAAAFMSDIQFILTFFAGCLILLCQKLDAQAAT
jgi:hypothetical protein